VCAENQCIGPVPDASPTTSSSGNLGAAGRRAGTDESASIPIVGRATCSMPASGPGGSPFALLGLAGLAAGRARRRRP
jgi:MYXO-CTERM domain-containing protein